MHWLAGAATGFLTWSVLFLVGNALIKRVIPGAENADGVVVGVGALVSILALTAVYSVASGAIASRLSGVQGARAARVLGVLLLITGVSVQSAYWEVLPLWYHLVFLLQLFPATQAGHFMVSHLRVRRP